MVEKQGVFGLFERYKERFPEVISRKQLVEELGGLLSVRTLANLDSQGKGPGQKIMIGRKVGYPKAVVLVWLKQRMKIQ